MWFAPEESAQSGRGVMDEARSRKDTKHRTTIQNLQGTESQGGQKTLRVVPTSVQTVEADGVRVFYRTAGDPSAPAVLLLHGFPASSFMFRELIPRLASDYRVVAPDLPGFGFTQVPSDRKYEYTFDQLSLTIDAFTRALN